MTKKPNYYPPAFDRTQVEAAPTNGFKRALGLAFLMGVVAYCFFTGRELSPGSLSLRNLLLLIATFKILTWMERPSTPLSYFLWIGMNPHEFESSPHAPEIQRSELIRATLEIVSGFALVFLAIQIHSTASMLTVSWITTIGLTLIIYFGTFRLLAWIWQKLGKGAIALMNRPFTSSNLIDFWSQRWNRAFPFVMHIYFYEPLLPRVGRNMATMIAFLFSGIVHELLMSVPVGSGYGLPILYFLIQGTGMCLVKSKLGKELRLTEGLRARIFGLFLPIVCLPILFHQGFMESIAYRIFD